MVISLTLDKPAHGGYSVGRYEGRVVFCRGGLPGETVSAEVPDPDPQARFWRAEALRVQGADAAGRVSSPCAWYRPGGCGGCSWLHADESTQLAMKEQVLAEVLQMPVGLRSLGLSHSWRTRLTLHTDAYGRAGLHPHRSHDVLPLTDCLQADERLDIAELLARQWPARIDILASVSDAGRAVTWRLGRQRFAEGPAQHRHQVSGRTFLAAADGFWQSHRLAAQALADVVSDWAAVPDGGRLVDLYAGVGLFGLVLSDRFDGGSVDLVEGDRRAVRYARSNAGSDARVAVRHQDVRAWAHGDVEAADVVVLDPPRAGAGAHVVGGIARTGATTVVYVSCEPSTLARDITMFADLGFHVDRVEGLDLFPGTAHVESVVRLVRPT